MISDSRCAERMRQSPARAVRPVFTPSTPFGAEQFVRVAQHVILLFAGAIERNLPFLLRNVKAEAGVVHRVTGQARHVRRGGIRQSASRSRRSRADSTKQRALHPERLGERIHLADEKRDRGTVASRRDDRAQLLARHDWPARRPRRYPTARARHKAGRARWRCRRVESR